MMPSTPCRSGRRIATSCASTSRWGLGEASNVGAGIYVWPSIEAARTAHDEAWRESVKKHSGSLPQIQHFDMFLLIDNEAGKVTE